MRRVLPVLLLVCLAAPVVAAWAQGKAPKVVKRAQPPKLGKTSISFYADAFQEGLQGDRPGNLGQAVVASPMPAARGNPASPKVASAASGTGWSGLISATTIEDEVKALKMQIDQNVTTPSDFAGKGYKAARRDLSMLAMLFGIAGEYEGEVRWKKDAPAARDVFARTAANAKVGTSQVFQEAKLRKEELGEMIGGSSPFTGKEAEVKASWKDVCNRAPLMQHLEVIWEPRLKPLLSDKGQFAGNADKVLHDAEIIAAMGEVLAKEGMEDADSDEYKKFCENLRDGAKAVIEGVKSKNYEQAAAGSATIGKACVECHENYRS